MKEDVIQTAGRLWDALEQIEDVNIRALPAILKEDPITTFQALGWLAREDKINYYTMGEKIFVSLNTIEQEVPFG